MTSKRKAKRTQSRLYLKSDRLPRRIPPASHNQHKHQGRSLWRTPLLRLGNAAFQAGANGRTSVHPVDIIPTHEMMTVM